MTIKSGDVKLLKSQVLLDTSDGGGAMTSNEVVDGLSNNLFPDISELDRTYGRVALRKSFAAITTTDTDSYFGAHAIISKTPADPRVSVSLFSTADWFDRRDAARDRIERYLARGPKWAGHLLEMQLEGQRAIQIAERTQDVEPKVGQGLCLVQFEGKPNEYEQYVRVTKVTSIERTFTVQGKDVVRKVLTVEISDPLRNNFEGPTVEQFESGNLGLAFCRDTRVANAATYYGAARLSTEGNVNDASIEAESIFTQLVPSAQSETPMVDLTASSLSSLYTPGNNLPINTSFNGTIGPTNKLFIGSPIMPGSLNLTAGGSIITDDAGTLKSGSTIVGGIEYDKGLLTFTANASTYSGAIQLAFTPAGAPTRVADTAAISIVQDTRGYNYTITLLPPPQPGSLVVSYMSQGKVYYLYDKGNGVLKGSDSAFGTGSISYATGSVIVTTGSLPDAGSEIIFSWGKAVTTFTRTDTIVKPTRIKTTLKNQQILSGSLEITWGSGVLSKAKDDGAGNITGDAKGSINYATGALELEMPILYAKGTEFTAKYQFGPPNEKKFDAPARGANGDVSITLPDAGGDIVPNSLELQWTVDIKGSDKFAEIEANYFGVPTPDILKGSLVTAFDNGTGGLRRPGGAAQSGSVNYKTREISINPDYEVSVPTPVWAVKSIGTSPQIDTGLGSSPVNRYQLSGWKYIKTLASMPLDASAYLLARWRTVAGGTAANEKFTAGDVEFDITPSFAENIVAGSVRFSLGNRTYVDRLGSLYHSIDPATGAGVAAGQIQYQSGVARLDDWPPGADNKVTLQSLVTEINYQPVDEVVFRVPIAPVRTGSVQIRAVPVDSATSTPVNVTADSTGAIKSPYMTGTVDYQSGVVRVRFGQVVLVDSTVQSQPWFTQEAVFTEGGQQKIVKPRPVYADTIRYNAVGYTYLPLNANILGLDPVRLPSDGRVPIFRTGDVCVVHNTQTTPFPGTPGVGAVLDVGRTRVSYIKVLDSAGTPISPDMYRTDLDAGIVTLNSSYVQGTAVLPLIAEHRIEDMGMITDVQINGRLALNKPLTHKYPANASLVSSALVFGDLQARVFNRFSQESWTNAWSDSIIGNPTTAQYNETLYPITNTNRGAIEEKWALIFTSSTSFRIVGRSVGQIATGDINTDLAPKNPATGAPYFSLKALGWGTGWSAGNVMRFNTAAANYPIWLARTVLQGPVTALNDGFQLQIRGGEDR